MAKPREPWNIRPAKKPVSVTASHRTEVEKKAQDLIENFLKPKSVLPPKKGEQFNYITDIGTKWYRNNFYFFLTYACPSPNALSPTFESKFARMEPLGDGKFALYAMKFFFWLRGDPYPVFFASAARLAACASWHRAASARIR